MNRAIGVNLTLATCLGICGCGTSPAPIPPNDHAAKTSAPVATASTQVLTTPAVFAMPAPPVKPPTLEWARRWGSFGSDNIDRLVSGPDGTWVIAGRYEFEIDLGGKKLHGESALQGNGGVFIAGFAPDGQLRWATDFHGKAQENINDLARGPDDTLFFTGGFRELNAGCGRIRSKKFDNVLVGAFAADGHCRWTHGHGNEGNEWGQAIAVDDNGNVTTFGVMRSGMNFGGGPIDIGEKSGTFVASFTRDGAHRWSRALWSEQLTFVQAATADAAGTVYVTIGFKGTVDFGDGPRTSHGSNDVALLALASDGHLLWSTSWGGPGFDAANGLTIDPKSGDVFLAGAFPETLDLGSDHLTSAGGTDAFVARFDKNGKAKWVRRFGGVEHDHFTRISLDEAGNSYVVGQMRASFDMGETTLKSAGNEDVFLVSLSPDGSARWALSFGGPEYDDARGLVVEPTGRILVAGRFASTMTVGSTKLKSAGNHDIFVVAWHP